MKTQRRLVASALALGLSALYGCSVDTSSDQPIPPFIPVPVNGAVAPRFDPITPGGGLSLIPIPNDILRDPATGLNTRVPEDPNPAAPANALRSIRGFSTTGNIIIPFDGQIDADTVTDQTMLVVEGEGSRDAAGSTGTNATVACNITVLNGTGSGNTNPSTVILQPKLPLKPLTNYYVVITQGIQSGGRPIGEPKTGGTQNINTGRLTKSTSPLVDANGTSLVFPVPDASAAQLEPLRQVYQGIWARAESITGLTRDQIPFAFRFGTQPLYASLASPANPASTNPPGGNPGLRTRASIEVGTTTPNPIPSVVTGPRAGAGLTSSRRGPVPAKANADGPIPVAAAPTSQALLGAPQTIAQFYADLTTAADGARFANASFANIGRIYMGNITTANYINPQTGFFEGENLPVPGSAGFTRFGDQTVPFYLILPMNVPGAAGPGFPGAAVPAVIYQHGISHDKRDVFLVADKLCQAGFGVIAIDLHLHGDLRPNPALPNGTGFINPGNLRASRDNIRQSISNLFFVSEAIIAGRSNVDGFPAETGATAVPDLTTPASISQPPVFTAGVNGPGPSYVGHSLGGIVGVPFTAVTPFSSKAVFTAAGGRITELLLGSVPRGQQVAAALQQAGIEPGSDAFRQFFFVAQTVLDDVDPLNYAAPTFLTQAQGGFKPDLTGRFAPGFDGQQRARVLLQELTGDQVIPNFATRDLARAFANLFHFGVDTGFRHVQPIQAAVEGVLQVASGFTGSGYFQFAPGLGHEAIVGLDGGPTSIVIDQIVRFLGTPQTFPTFNAAGGPITAP